MSKFVKVPEEMEPLFDSAEKYVSEYFSSLTQDPSSGTITVGGERYILVRAKSMSVHFFEFMKQMYPSMDDRAAIEGSSKILFDMAHVIGKNDAKNFHQKTKVENPIEKLSTGPLHFAHTGWAFVDIDPSSVPSPDEKFCLIYRHPQTFEADAWISHQEKTEHCTCFMNAGYSSGWCEESFGIPLVSKEISCRSRGDKECKFVMAQPHKIEEFINDIKESGD